VPRRAQEPGRLARAVGIQIVAGPHADDPVPLELIEHRGVVLEENFPAPDDVVAH
jgi:hypothetical protein